MGRPKEHDEATRRHLLDTAENLLAREGPEAVAVRRVAEEAGTSTRAVYSLFESKAGLLAALAVRGYSNLGDRLHALAPTGDPAADLIAIGLQGFRPFALERPQLFRLAFERVPAGLPEEPAVQQAAMDAYKALGATIERAQAAGVIDQRPTAEIAFAFHSLCQGMAGGELSREPPPVGSNFWGLVRGIDAEKLWRGALEALVAGLAPRAGDRRGHA